jgi:hypothetical protein
MIKIRNILLLCLLVPLLSFAKTQDTKTVLEQLKPMDITMNLTLPDTFEDPYDVAQIQQFSDAFRNIMNQMKNNLFPVNLHLIVNDQGFGGRLDKVTQLGNSMLYAQQQGLDLTMNVTGMAYSGNAYIACYANKISFEPGSGLMFHRPGGAIPIFFDYYYKFIPDSEPLQENTMNALYQQCVQKGFLTNLDVYYIKQGAAVSMVYHDGKLWKSYAQDHGSKAEALEGLVYLSVMQLLDLLIVMFVVYMIVRTIRNAWKN